VLNYSIALIPSLFGPNASAQMKVDTLRPNIASGSDKINVISLTRLPQLPDLNTCDLYFTFVFYTYIIPTSNPISIQLMACFTSSLRLLIFVCILSAGFCANSQSPITKRILRVIASGNVNETIRVFDSTHYKTTYEAFSDITFLQYASLFDDMTMFDALLARSRPVSQADFSGVAGMGSSQMLLRILEASDFTDIKDYDPSQLLTPLTDNARKLLRNALLKPKIDKADIEQIFDKRKNTTDLAVLNKVIERMETIADRAVVGDFLSEVAAHAQEELPSSGSQYILDKYTKGHVSVGQRLIHLIAVGETNDVFRVIDSSGYLIDRKAIQHLTLFQFALLFDNPSLLQGLITRAMPLTPDDLSIAAGMGSSPVFLKVLEASALKNIDDYENTFALLTPLTDSARTLLRSTLQKTDIDEDLLEDLLKDIDELPKEQTDTIALIKLITRIKMVGSKEEVTDFITAAALDAEINHPSVGSAYLLSKFFYNTSGRLGKGFEDYHFQRAFEKGRWSLVDYFLQRGYVPDLTEINLRRVSDPERALGYFVRIQLLDIGKDLKSLKANRQWVVPKMQVIIPGGPGLQAFKETPSFTKDYVATLGYTMILGGGCTPMSMSMNLPGGQGATKLGMLRFQLNLKAKEYIAGSCNDEFSIIIPASDTINWGEYHSLLIRNTGQFLNGFSNAIEPLRVYRNNELVEEIKTDREETVNRAFGPLEIRSRFSPLRTFGLTIEFQQHDHSPKVGTGVRSRLELYQALLRAINEASHIDGGTAEAFDARTQRRLVSEQLVESNVPNVIRGELRLAMQMLAEQSEFNAQFTNFVYEELIGSSVTGALEPFLTSPDPVVRRQAQVLRDALNRRTRLLSLIDDQNIKNYTDRIRRVQNLIYELAQYMDKDALRSALETTLNDLTPESRKKFIANARQSIGIWTVNSSDLKGKGETVKSFLQF
jgi:hypothetical protein